MQTMPTKNRTTLLLAGLGLLVLVGVAAAFGLNNRAGEEAAPDQLTAVAGPENGTPLVDSPDTMMGAATTETDLQGAAEEVSAAPATDLGAMSAEALTAEAQASTTTMAPVPVTHEVREGETLYEISAHYYGDEVYAGDIEALNNIPDPNKIYAGQVLELPRPETLSYAGE